MLRARTLEICLSMMLVTLVLPTTADAYARYLSGCQSCHGRFTDSTSPKGTTFPSGDKHQMHRSSSAMNTNCNLCHSAGDGRNPYLGFSSGTASTTGYGCVGCHGRVEDGGNDSVSQGYGAGLRQHHYNNNVTGCTGCHDDASPVNYTTVGEDVLPPYYGSPDTNIVDIVDVGGVPFSASCNPAPGFEENWSIGDTLGLDNDGNNIYDLADPQCVPEPGAAMMGLAALITITAARRRASRRS